MIFLMNLFTWKELLQKMDIAQAYQEAFRNPLQYYFPWRFRDGWDLKRHIEIKHQDLHVHCALCEKVYKRKDKLREHLLKDHTALGDI